MSSEINIRKASDQIPKYPYDQVLGDKHLDTTKESVCNYCNLPEEMCEYRYTMVNMVPMFIRMCQVRDMRN